MATVHLPKRYDTAFTQSNRAALAHQFDYRHRVVHRPTTRGDSWECPTCPWREDLWRSDYAE